MRNYLKSLFDEGEHVCSGDTPFETRVQGTEKVTASASYVTLNALEPGSTRADKNVVKLRSFLLEFDGMPLDEQIPFVENTGLPYTTCVFSGNKSYHFVVSLTEPVETPEQYRRLVRWLYKAIPEVDQSCKNPSRFTRLGGGTHKNGKAQTLEDVRGRVGKELLYSWLQSRCDEPEDETRGVKQLADEEFKTVQSSGYRAKIHGATLKFIKTGGRKGHRHKNIFIAACNLRDCYYTLDEAKFLLLAKVEKIYEAEGKGHEVALKERAVEDAFLITPRQQNRG